MIAPSHIRMGIPSILKSAKPLASTYTAVFVVNAVIKTAPVIVASGYASGNHA